MHTDVEKFEVKTDGVFRSEASFVQESNDVDVAIGCRCDNVYQTQAGPTLSNGHCASSDLGQKLSYPPGSIEIALGESAEDTSGNQCDDERAAHSLEENGVLDLSEGRLLNPHFPI